MSVNKADFVKQQVYPNEIESYINLIKESSGRNFDNNSFVSEGGWVSRRSGRDLNNNQITYSDKVENENLAITISMPKTDWREWHKTLDGFSDIRHKIKKVKNGYSVTIPSEYVKANPVVVKLIKQVFRKSACCVRCGVCESNCSAGHLDFNNGLSITNCIHCLNCHNIDSGCLVYNSLRIPKEEKTMSVNCYDTTLPKNSWFDRYFTLRDKYWDDHMLGPNQVKSFRSILRHAGLLEKNKFTHLGGIIAEIGWESDIAWGILLTNLAVESPQFQWYIVHLELNSRYSRQTVLSMLSEINDSKNVVKNVYSAYGKLTELPLGTSLHFGHVTDKGDLVRTKCSISDHRVVLYGLFKFAEKCNDYKEFTLATLLNDTIERDGISPTRIFGLDRDDMMPILLGLTAKYPDFIIASFTHDLEKITLATDKSSQDVLNLFRRGKANVQE
jgi:phosphoadenosine phosphosulfate reductase